jgi:hypothetical protein
MILILSLLVKWIIQNGTTISFASLASLKLHQFVDVW